MQIKVLCPLKFIFKWKNAWIKVKMNWEKTEDRKLKFWKKFICLRDHNIILQRNKFFMAILKTEFCLPWKLLVIILFSNNKLSVLKNELREVSNLFFSQTDWIGLTSFLNLCLLYFLMQSLKLWKNANLIYFFQCFKLSESEMKVQVQCQPHLINFMSVLCLLNKVILYDIHFVTIIKLWIKCY